MTEDTRPYIRPCAAFPDGYFLPPEVVDRLVAKGLIERDTWSENHTDYDYAAIYSEDEMEQVAYDIERVVRQWIAPWTQRPHRLAR